MFWRGVAAAGDRRFDTAQELFSDAWHAARLVPSFHAAYAGIAVLDTSVVNDGLEHDAEQLIAELAQLVNNLGRDRANDLDGSIGKLPPADGQLPHDVNVAFNLRDLLSRFDALDQVPLASWQFRAILGGGIRQLLMAPIAHALVASEHGRVEH